MIRAIRIRNLAVIDDVEVSFGPGLNVLTGETGAGKSIVIAALDILLGARVSADIVRSGASRVEIEGVFHVAQPEVAAFLAQADLTDPDAPDELIVRRVIPREGRSRVWVNGVRVPLAVVRDLGASLVDVSGQHAHYALLDERSHLSLLDRFANLAQAVAQVAGAHQSWSKLEAERAALLEAEKQRAEREEFVRFQLKEIEAAGVEPGEMARIEAERKRLAHAERLRAALAEAGGALTEGASAAAAALARAERLLRDAAQWDEAAAALAERVESARIEVEDVGFEVARLAAGVHADPAALEALEERAAALRRVLRRFGPTEEAVVERAAALRAELDRYETAEHQLAQLDERVAAARAQLEERARALTQARKRAAGRLARAVECELGDLGLGAARFRVRVSARPEGRIGPDGADRVVFEIAPNPGEGWHALARSASGGELSRILLAIKTALSGADPVPTSVYDEVDAGVGGAVAEHIARRLWRSSRGRQVLCITHLPQIAAWGERHLHVEKTVEGGRTASRVRALEGDERVEEIARMLGGIEVTDRARAHARDLLARARAEREASERDGGRAAVRVGGAR